MQVECRHRQHRWSSRASPAGVGAAAGRESARLAGPGANPAGTGGIDFLLSGSGWSKKKKYWVPRLSLSQNGRAVHGER